LPSKNSKEAPPPVETQESLSATPNFLAALAESPPPTTTKASIWVKNSAISLVP